MMVGHKAAAGVERPYRLALAVAQAGCGRTRSPPPHDGGEQPAGGCIVEIGRRHVGAHFRGPSTIRRVPCRKRTRDVRAGRHLARISAGDCSPPEAGAPSTSASSPMRRMLRAAFTSRSWTVPQSQRHILLFKPAWPFGPAMLPHSAQTWVVHFSETSSVLPPCISALYES